MVLGVWDGMGFEDPKLGGGGGGWGLRALGFQGQGARPAGVKIGSRRFQGLIRWDEGRWDIPS